MTSLKPSIERSSSGHSKVLQRHLATLQRVHFMRNVLACAGRSGGSTISINKGRRAARRLRIRALGSTGESQSRPDSQLLVIINLPAPLLTAPPFPDGCAVRRDHEYRSRISAPTISYWLPIRSNGSTARSSGALRLSAFFSMRSPSSASSAPSCSSRPMNRRLRAHYMTGDYRALSNDPISGYPLGQPDQPGRCRRSWHQPSLNGIRSRPWGAWSDERAWLYVDKAGVSRRGRVLPMFACQRQSI